MSMIERLVTCALPWRTGAYLSGDKFHLNDLGYQCMAEYAARAIMAGITQANAERPLNK